MAQDSVIYRIDGKDRITSANREWDRFALGNASEHLVSERVGSRSLWDFITDDTTRLLYRDMLKIVRSGREVSFPFRCDSAECRRFLEMHARKIDDDSVEFEVRTLAVEERPRQRLLENGGERTDAVLRMCGWCKKMPIGERWVEIEEAVAELGLFEASALPLISHGICAECEETTLKRFEASERARKL